jgi:hypothetical protein
MEVRLRIKEKRQGIGLISERISERRAKTKIARTKLKIDGLILKILLSIVLVIVKTQNFQSINQTIIIFFLLINSSKKAYSIMASSRSGSL